MRIRKARPAEARRQADWIVTIAPWRGLGYRAPALGLWLQRLARRGWVRVAVDRDAVIAVLVLQPEFLLGGFISLLAVRPDAQGRGVGKGTGGGGGAGRSGPAMAIHVLG